MYINNDRITEIFTHKMHNQCITLIHCNRKKMGVRNRRYYELLKFFGTFISEKENQYHFAEHECSDIPNNKTMQYKFYLYLLCNDFK